MKLFSVILLSLILILSLVFFTRTNSNKKPEDVPVKERTFRTSKKLIEKIYSSNRQTFYCGCEYDEYKQIDLDTCGYKPRKNINRAKRVEWEHIVPAAYFGRNLSCWKDGGRASCSSKSNLFSNFEGDLHNLVPAIGEINGDRGDKIHAEVEGFSVYGQCDFVISGRKAMPRKEIRGDVARIWLYMADKYEMFLSAEMKETFNKWHTNDPVDDYERWRNEEIMKIQGDSNKYIK